MAKRTPHYCISLFPVLGVDLCLCVHANTLRVIEIFVKESSIELLLAHEKQLMSNFMGKKISDYLGENEKIQLLILLYVRREKGVKIQFAGCAFLETDLTVISEADLLNGLVSGSSLEGWSGEAGTY